MRLTRFADIGLRVLMYLYRQNREEVTITVAEISAQFDIPHNHLVKVVGHLVKRQLLIAIRGRNGGIRLGALASQVKIGQLIADLENHDELVNCEELQCRLKSSCLLRNALQLGLNAFYEAMDRYTLADIAGGRTGEQIIQLHRDFLKKEKVLPENSTI